MYSGFVYFVSGKILQLVSKGSKDSGNNLNIERRWRKEKLEILIN